MLEAVHIASNKNTVPGDVSAMVPGGIRMGKKSYLGSYAFFFLYTNGVFLEILCHCYFQVLLLSLPEDLSRRTLPK